MDDSLTAPAAVPAGPTRIEVMNHGTEPHQAALVRLEPGRTPRRVPRRARPEPRRGLRGRHLRGGPNGAEPGQHQRGYRGARAGHYVVLFLIPSPDGTPHVVKGMITELDVTGPARSRRRSRRAPPWCASRSSTSASRASSCRRCRPARRRRRQRRRQAHELVVSRLPNGVKVADVEEWSDHPLFTPEAFPQPQVDVAGATKLDPVADSGPPRPAARGLDVAVLPPDARSEEKSHLQQGMAYPFTVADGSSKGVTWVMRRRRCAQMLLFRILWWALRSRLTVRRERPGAVPRSRAGDERRARLTGINDLSPGSIAPNTATPSAHERQGRPGQGSMTCRRSGGTPTP